MLAHLQRRVYKHLHEVFVADQLACHLTLGAEGADEGGHDDHPRVHHQLGDFRHPADVFDAVGISEAEIFVQPLSDVVTVQDVGALALGVEFLFKGVGQRGLAGAGQTGEPDNLSLVAIEAFPCNDPLIFCSGHTFERRTSWV